MTPTARVVLLLSAAAIPVSTAEFVTFFDGKSLDGWEIREGEEKWWTVKDGCITGGSLAEKVPHNTFLTCRKPFQNFELKLKVRLVEGEGFQNSGVQVRSRRVPDNHEMIGYQVDAGINWWGKLYDESRRREVISEPVDPAALARVVHDFDGWNDYRIVCEGPRIRSWINGVAALDFEEADPKIPLDGYIGLQAHGNGRFLVQFKDITVREMPPTEGAPTWRGVSRRPWPRKKPPPRKAAPRGVSARRPNVVVIFADDLGYGDLGCYGATKVKTPHIDRLAAEGKRFTDAHSASAVCTPSRYALLTGEYPLRKNLSRPVFLKTGLVIDSGQQTMADVMKEAGYATACFGKWHLGFGKGAPDWNGDLKPGPLELGFDYYFGVPVVNSHPPFVWVENHRVVGLAPEDPFVFGKEAKTREFFEKMGTNQIGGADAAHALYDDEAVGTTLAERAVDWIKARKRDPFFLYLATTHIHHPFTPHPRFRGTSECGVYGDFIHELDWMVGEIMNTLEGQGVADNTLVLFTSDNGGMFNVGGQNAWDAGHRLNGELLGFKFGAWEGGHRVPFIARWPGKIGAGSESDELVSNVDVIATLADLTGVALRKGQGRDSVSILPALTGNPEKPIRDHLVLAASKPTHLGVRKGKWMYIRAQGSGGFTAAKRGAHAFGGPAAITYAGYENSDIADGKIKPGAPPAQLYNLEKDLQQTTNLYREHPEKVKELSALLARYSPSQPEPPKQRSRPKRAAADGAAGRGPARPNFIVIFADDQGYEDVGCYGSKAIRTPHLDQLAAEGMRFTDFYAQPICGPSRAAIMTGCYPLRVAEKGNAKNFHPILHEKEITIAEVLEPLGYATGCFGKWDLARHSQRDFVPELMPNGQGFDYFFGTPSSNDRIVDLYRNGERIEREAPMATLTKRYTEEALAFIDRHRDQPFFVYLPHTMPHTKLAASADFRGKSPRGLYGDVIEEIDHGVGRIVAKVRELGLAGNTWIIYTSDNGPWLIKNQGFVDGRAPAHHGGSAGPLRSGKVSTWEGGVRVPCIAWAPGRVPAGTVCRQIASTMDLLPTIAALAGTSPPDDRVIDGGDISPLLRGEFDAADPGKTYCYYFLTHLQGVRQGKWKLVLPRPEDPRWLSRHARNQHIHPDDDGEIGEPLLFDLKADIGETTNVAKGHPEIVERLLGVVEATRGDLGDYNRVGRNMRFFDPMDSRPTRPPTAYPIR